MNTHPVTTAVDISPEVVEALATELRGSCPDGCGCDNAQAADMLRTLRSSLTAAEKQRDEALAHEGEKDLRIADLSQRARTLESAVRGNCGIILEDGYEVNVADLQHRLTASEKDAARYQKLRLHGYAIDGMFFHLDASDDKVDGL